MHTIATHAWMYNHTTAVLDWMYNHITITPAWMYIHKIARLACFLKPHKS